MKKTLRWRPGTVALRDIKKYAVGPPWPDVDSLPTCPDCCTAIVLWALSAKARNRLVHALNGNPGHPRVLPGFAFPKDLRALGWEIPPEVETPCKVFDTRLTQQEIKELAQRRGLGDLAIVGGDFLTAHALGAQAFWRMALRWRRGRPFGARRCL